MQTTTPVDDEKKHVPVTLDKAASADDHDVLSATLKQHFGYSTLKPFQRSIVSAVLRGQDTFVLMATGSGKSLCYQLPPLVSGRICIVISPLISLMQNQVHALQQHNIKACYLGGGRDAHEQQQIEQQAASGEFSLVYLTPEKLVHWFTCLAEIHRTRGIGLVAIDEAHCISEFGHDFRLEYRRIQEVRSILPGVPIMALTATATARVEKDIVANLKLLQPVQAKASFDRPNLSFAVLRKQTLAHDMTQLFKEPRRTPGFTLIYCNTQKETERVAAFLCDKLHLRAAAYHAGKDADVRKRLHDDFVYDKLDAMAATTAFGMGIDRPDIRRVVHYGAPKSLEAHYQQVGRGSRDGLPAECIMFWSEGDFATNMRLIRSSSEGHALALNLELLEKMRQFTFSTDCRRQVLLNYFGETIAACGNCDICRQAHAGTGTGTARDANVDCHAEAAALLSAVEQTGSRFGLTLPIDVLMGSRQKKIMDGGFHGLPSFGAGRSRSAMWWKSFARVLMQHKLLDECIKDGKFTIVSVTPAGRQWLHTTVAAGRHGSESTLMLRLPPELLPEQQQPSTRPRARARTATHDDDNVDSQERPAKRAKSASTVSATGELYTLLANLRLELAQSLHVPPFFIFHNKHLQDMASKRPTTLTEFQKCEGVGTHKSARYGPAFVAAIDTFCRAKGLKK